MKVVLITGGAGFLGSHLCDRFIRAGYKVICLDNLITGSLKNIAHLKKNKYFNFIRHNICEYINIKDRIDMVFHLASPASPIDYLRYPIQTLKVGSLGTHNALGIAKRKGALFVLASTSEVYGDPKVHPQPESYYGNVNCVGLRGVYDEAKRFAEAMTTAYHRVHKLDTKIARIFNTYGPRMRREDGRAIPNFIIQALTNKPITIYGKGMQTRSFCYVSDLIEGIYLLSQSSVNEPINLGNPDEWTILDLAKKIIEITGSKSRIIYKALPEDDPKIRQPDITKARRFLKWNPQISLEKGLGETINWFKDFYKDLN